jgi:multimeric flavodoxin WrbA
MNVLAISGSPRKNGNTVLLLNRALEGARAEGAETEVFSVAGKELHGCDGCWACMKTGVCHIKDGLTGLYDLMAEADGLIFGTPIYFWGMTSQMKAVIDRTIAFNHGGRTLASKVAGAVVVAGSLGLVDALKDFAWFFVQRRLLPANTVCAYARDPQATGEMPGLMQDAYDLGRQVATLVRMGFKYPPEFIKGPGAFGVGDRR